MRNVQNCYVPAIVCSIFVSIATIRIYSTARHPLSISTDQRLRRLSRNKKISFRSVYSRLFTDHSAALSPRFRRQSNFTVPPSSSVSLKLHDPPQTKSNRPLHGSNRARQYRSAYFVSLERSMQFPCNAKPVPVRRWTLLGRDSTKTLRAYFCQAALEIARHSV